MERAGIVSGGWFLEPLSEPIEKDKWDEGRRCVQGPRRSKREGKKRKWVRPSVTEKEGGAEYEKRASDGNAIDYVVRVRWEAKAGSLRRSRF